MSSRSLGDSDSDATERAQRTYNRVAKTYAFEQSLMGAMGLSRLRRDLWARIPAGRVLEVGVGTGQSFACHAPEHDVVAIDFSEEMLKRAKAKARRDDVPVELLQMDAQALEFPDANFDHVVTSCVFCSVPDPVLGLKEVLRVLRPGGSAHFLEHVRSQNRVVGKLMDLANPVAVRMSGANINRRTVENIAAAGLEVVSDERHLFGIVRVVEARRPTGKET